MALGWKTLKKILKGEKGILATLTLFAATLFAVLVFVGGFASFVQYSNTMEFCISCHEMESTVYQEYKESRHFQTRTGARPTCANCHVPHDNWMKMVTFKVMATKELFLHVTGALDTKEKFEAKRLELAETVWARMEANDSANCRACHKVAAWDLALQTPRARGQHESAETNGETCIDCHKGIAHKSIHEELEEEEEFEPFELN